MIADVGGIVNVSGSRMATPFGPAQAGQHADDDAEHDADHHHAARCTGQRDGKPVEQSGQFIHGAVLRRASVAEQGFERPLAAAVP